MVSTTLRIAILDCDTPVPNVYAERGLYSDIFISLLEDAAEKTPGLPQLNFEFNKYDAVQGNLPSEEDLIRIDAIIITGSSASAYDLVPWIISLTSFTKKIYTHHPSIKLFGSCFGHQLLCQSLLSPSHSPQNQSIVHPLGWELGIHPISLSSPFLTHFGPVLSNTSSPSVLRLQFVHADHVVLPPTGLPQGWESVGQTEKCELQGVWEKGRVLTLQGHAEFDEFVNGETLKVFGKGWDEGVLEAALRGVEGVDDAVWVAGVMLRFFLEKRVEGQDGVMARL